MPLFTRLRVWKLAHQMSLDVYRVTKGYPRHEPYGLITQMRRAAVSVGANIAEGQKHQTRRDFSRFITDAEGSVAELQHYVILSRQLGYLAAEDAGLLTEQTNDLERMLFGLQRNLRRRLRELPDDTRWSAGIANRPPNDSAINDSTINDSTPNEQQ